MYAKDARETTETAIKVFNENIVPDEQAGDEAKKNLSPLESVEMDEIVKEITTACNKGLSTVTSKYTMTAQQNKVLRLWGFKVMEQNISWD